MQRPKNTATGINKETAVKRWLKRHGWDVPRHGTIGAEDIIARKNSRVWYIQVKYTRKVSSSYREVYQSHTSEFRRLKIKATKNSAVPVFAIVIQKYVWFISVRSNILLAKGQL